MRCCSISQRLRTRPSTRINSNRTSWHTVADDTLIRASRSAQLHAAFALCGDILAAWHIRMCISACAAGSHSASEPAPGMRCVTVIASARIILSLVCELMQKAAA